MQKHTPGFFFACIAFVLAVAVNAHSSTIYAAETEFYSVKVIGTENTKQVRVETVNKKGKQEQFVVDTLSDRYISSPQYVVGDRLIVSVTQAQGKRVVSIIERDRTIPYLVLAALFVATVVVVGRLQGGIAIIAMALSFMLLVTVTIPQIIAGVDPIVVSLLTALIIVPLTFYLSHGLNQKTSLAILATLIALAITGFMSAFFTQITPLTGYASDEAAAITLRFGDMLKMSNLLIAGMIISSMGILDDVTIAQIGIVQSLHKAKPNMHARQLFLEAMKLGRDHIASLVNTLILVYVGAALPMFLLVYKSDAPLWVVIQREVVAEEIVRTLVSSVGIILAVPIATTFGIKWGRKKRGFLQREKLF
ncbi:YibE/F family protein [Candidatus Woesebacteria bacterium]|nr:YibE/F family protein [Candidatus Woesebacteria bacterium]